MSNGHLLFESIFERKLSAGDTQVYLEKIAEEHPYFSPAHFFLLLNTAPDVPGYQQLAARTNVLFNNAYWLQFQLQEEREALEQPQQAMDESVEEFESTPATNAESVAVLNEHEPNSDTASETIAHTVPVEEEILALPVAIPEKTIALATIDNASVPVVADPVQEIVNVDEVAGVNPTQLDRSSPSEESLLPPAGVDELPVEKTEAKAEEGPVNNVIPMEVDQKTADTSQPVHFNNQSTPLVNESEKEEDISAEQETIPLHFKLNFDTPATTEDTITFEPLYTSDYFASQGIKLSQDIKPNDKLGKQLKSFTEWLKTMKKVHNDQLQPLSGQADKSIQKLAEQSNKDDAVVTEAMADVLLKQGKAEKAIEVYKKLSLLNPSKSTYFAAKIDQLKEH